MPHEKIYSANENAIYPQSYLDVAWGLQTITGKESHRGVMVGHIHPEYKDDHGSYGHYLELDRTRINKLIRALRRARDQAYGKDE